MKQSVKRQAKSTIKRIQSIKTRYVVLVFLLLIGVVVAGYFGRQWYLASHPHANINFQGFQPTVLPPGIHFDQAQLELWVKDGKKVPYQAGVALNDSEKDVNMRLFKFTNSTAFHCRWYGSSDDECRFHSTPAGQSYRVITAWDTQDGVNKSWSKEFSFVRDGTYIVVRAKNEQTDIPHKSWEEMIDSLKPVKYTNLQVRHFTPGP